MGCVIWSLGNMDSRACKTLCFKAKHISKIRQVRCIHPECNIALGYDMLCILLKAIQCCFLRCGWRFYPIADTDMIPVRIIAGELNAQQFTQRIPVGPEPGRIFCARRLQCNAISSVRLYSHGMHIYFFPHRRQPKALFKELVHLCERTIHRQKVCP